MTSKAPLNLTLADVDRIVNKEEKYIDYLWPESNIAVHISNIGQNHSGLEADFAAEYPIGTEIKSGIRLYMEKLGDRRNIIRALHEIPIEFKEWDKLIEYAFSDVVKTYKELTKRIDDEIPEALTADDILALDTPQTPWIIQDILVDEGITILASLPKKGKTVIALNMVKAAQTGTKFLNRVIPNVPILYLALEDTKPRLKTRLSTIGISGKQITFILNCDITQGLAPLKKLIELYHPKIVVIDTLLAALHLKEENSAELGIAAQSLHDLAREMKVSMLILHHHGKSRRDDPMLDLRGHSSLSGAVDVIMGLYAEEQPGQFKLKSASRDGESLDLDLVYNGNKLEWAISEDYQENVEAETDLAMVELLQELGESSIEAIGLANGKSRPANDKVLKRLMSKGTVQRKAQRVGYQTMFVYYLE